MKEKQTKKKEKNCSFVEAGGVCIMVREIVFLTDTFHITINSVNFTEYWVRVNVKRLNLMQMLFT